MNLDPQPALVRYLSKLERRRRLAPDERAAMLALPATVRQVEDKKMVLREDQPAEACVFLISGLLSRQRHTNGTGRIISISFPGDAVDMQTLFFDRTDHALVAHQLSTVAYVPHGALFELCDRHPVVAKMLWHDTLVDSAIFREWAMNVGHRRAPDRIGFLLLEYQARLAAIGDVEADGSFRMLLKQHEMASALGLSLVHMNKSLRHLREEKLIAMQGRRFQILDRQRLVDIVGFDATYLHLSESAALQKAAHLSLERLPLG